MKKLFFCLILIILLTSSCATHDPFYVDKPYGFPAPYGEGSHPGIDFDISTGTPIITISDGQVIYIGEPKGPENGITVHVVHGKYFKSVYGHMSKIFVEYYQLLKRGQLIGISGASNNYGKMDYQHLHFGICKIGGRCSNYSETYDPNMFWLGSRPQCFNPNMDYSNYSQKDITSPIACGDYGKALIAESRRKVVKISSPCSGHEQ